MLVILSAMSRPKDDPEALPKHHQPQPQTLTPSHLHTSTLFIPILDPISASKTTSYRYNNRISSAQLTTASTTPVSNPRNRGAKPSLATDRGPVQDSKPY